MAYMRVRLRLPSATSVSGLAFGMVQLLAGLLVVPLGSWLYGPVHFGAWLLLFTAATVVSAASSAIGQTLWAAVARQTTPGADKRLLETSRKTAGGWSLPFGLLSTVALLLVAWHIQRGLAPSDIWRAWCYPSAGLLAVYGVIALRLTPYLFYVAGRGALTEHYALQGARAVWRVAAIAGGSAQPHAAMLFMAGFWAVGDTAVLVFARRRAHGILERLPASDNCLVLGENVPALSLRFLGLQGASIVSSSVGPFAASWFGGLAAVPAYLLVQKMAAALLNVTQLAQGPLTNTYGRALAEEDTNLIVRTLRRAATSSVGVCTLAWVGLSSTESYWARVALPHPGAGVALLVAILMAYPAVYGLAISAGSFVGSTTRVGKLVLINMAEASSNLILAISLGALFGVPGVASAQLVAAMLTSVWMVPLLAHRLGGDLKAPTLRHIVWTLGGGAVAVGLLLAS